MNRRRNTEEENEKVRSWLEQNPGATVGDLQTMTDLSKEIVRNALATFRRHNKAHQLHYRWHLGPTPKTDREINSTLGAESPLVRLRALVAEINRLVGEENLKVTWAQNEVNQLIGKAELDL